MKHFLAFMLSLSSFISGVCLVSLDSSTLCCNIFYVFDISVDL